MSRPTLSLALIVKNEKHNLPILFDSIKGCFDEICVLDTGSTDGTIEWLTDLQKTGFHGAQIKLGFFEWIQDFAAARNESFKLVTSDYVMWLDADDALEKPEDFKIWRDTAMAYADYWLAPYNYAQDDKGQSVCKFVRERVFSRKHQLNWEYFVHEGIKPDAGMKVQMIYSWEVRHRRTQADLERDKGRNLGIFEKKMAETKANARMRFYYGKELFENKRPMEAFSWLLDAAADATLENHDRMLSLQYAGYAAMECNQFDKAIQMAHQGLQLDPKRAEYYTIIGDSYLKQNKLTEALPFYSAAKNCVNHYDVNGKHFGALYNHPDAYGPYPSNQVSKILFNMGAFAEALAEAKKCFEKFGRDDTKQIISDIEKAMDLTSRPSTIKPTDDIVFSTPPMHAYPWDEEIYKTKGLGGSETACVEMASWLKKKTNRRVIVFGPREEKWIAPSGVEYWPLKEINNYFKEFKPYRHIAWRHNIKVTEAKTYLWCHDLITPSVESANNFDHILCLSDFHKNYVQAMQGVPPEKVIVTRNGINPERFKQAGQVRNPFKIIWPNSPDRGLERAIRIIEKAKEKMPELELHCFYGMENLEKYGLGELAKKLRDLFSTRPWVKYVGNVDQNRLVREFQESSVWLYPASFIETFCISALESVCAGAYPLVRYFGALQNTLKPLEEKGMATILDLDCETEEQVAKWADELCNIIEAKKWEKISVDPAVYSWESVADEWIKFMEL